MVIISRLLEDLQSGSAGIGPGEIEVEAVPAMSSELDEPTIAAADLTRPLVLAEIAPGRFNLIDGHHRAEKARREGVRKLLAYRLSAEEHIAFLTTEQAYRAYVDYWNGKLKVL